MKHPRGALIPPGFYDKHHRVGKKLADANYYGFIDYALGAGFDGMAVLTRWNAESTAKIYCQQFGGTLKSVTAEGKTVSAWQAYVDGIEVLFSVK